MSLQNPIVFDPSREIPLYFRINRDGVPQTLTFTDQGTGLPYTVNTKTWQLNIKNGYWKNIMLEDLVAFHLLLD